MSKNFEIWNILTGLKFSFKLFKIGVLKHFAIFNAKRLRWSLFLDIDSSTGVFLCEYCEIFKNSFFYRTTSELGMIDDLSIGICKIIWTLINNHCWNIPLLEVVFLLKLFISSSISFSRAFIIWRMLGIFLYFIIALRSGPVMPSIIGSKSLWTGMLRLFTMFGKNLFKSSAVSDSDLTIFPFSNNFLIFSWDRLIWY